MRDIGLEIDIPIKGFATDSQRGVLERLRGSLGEGPVTLTFNAYPGRGVK